MHEMAPILKLYVLANDCNFGIMILCGKSQQPTLYVNVLWFMNTQLRVVLAVPNVGTG